MRGVSMRLGEPGPLGGILENPHLVLHPKINNPQKAQLITQLAQFNLIKYLIF